MTRLLPSIILLFALSFTGLSLTFAQSAPVADNYEITLLPDGQWWGGLSHDAGKMPHTSQTKLTRDLWGNNDENQAQPLLIPQLYQVVNGLLAAIVDP